jgi:putative peptidoglycan lipid II flippase
VTAPVDERRSLARSTATQTVLTAVSRVTGFVRVVVVAAVLGTTFLGNTYQSANTIPNIVFELFAAGALQAVLVPALVARFDRGEDEQAERLAGSVLGLTLAVLAGLAVLGALASPLLMRALVSGVDDPTVRADQVSLGTVFLLVFLPQILVYDVGLVATAVLHARGRFALPAIAPAVNNVVVCGAYGLFWWMRRGEEPSLDLSVAEIAVLAGGTTFGVVAFCALPIVGAHRAGFRFRPNLDRSDPALRSLARQGGWAALFLAMTQVFLAAVLVFANRSEGGVIAYQVGFTFFLLPHSLFALPVLTTLFPAAARHVHAQHWDQVRATVRRGTTAIALFVLPSAVALGVLAEPLARVASFGNVGRGGAELIADVVRGFAPGLVGYALFYFLTRMLYAMEDTRTPATVHAVVVVIGVGAMAVTATTLEGGGLVASLAWVHSATYLAGAVALAVVVSRRLRRHDVPIRLPAALAPQVGGAVAATAIAAGIVAAVQAESRLGALGVVVLGGTAAAAAHVVVQAVLGGPRPTAIVGLLRSAPTAGEEAAS